MLTKAGGGDHAEHGDQPVSPWQLTLDGSVASSVEKQLKIVFKLCGFDSGSDSEDTTSEGSDPKAWFQRVSVSIR